MMDKIGVFLCTGCSIGEKIDAEAFQEAADEAGAITFVSHSCLCSEEGVAAVRDAISADGLGAVAIAACSKRVKVAEFNFEELAIGVERVPLREQVAWPLDGDEEDTQMAADDLIRMALAKLGKTSLPVAAEEEVNETILVVGGGLAGLTAASAVAGLGHEAVIVESAEALGGYLKGVAYRIPSRPPYNVIHKNEIHELIAKVEQDPRIKIFVAARIESISGQPGQFDICLRSNGKEQTLRVGAIIQATGARPYDASMIAHLGYAGHADVVTTQELEAMIASGSFARPSDGRVPERVVFVQCAGSRDPEHLPYCSGECCATSLKLVMAIRELSAKTECLVVYRDMRTPGQLEHFYDSAQAHAPCTRGEVRSVSSNGSGALRVEMHDQLLAKDLTVEADLVVLATGMVPVSADGEAIRQLRDALHRADSSESEIQRKEAASLAEGLRDHQNTEILNLNYRQGPDLPLLKYSFPDSHFICFPYETRRTGIYAAGAVHAPMDATQAEEDGWGAAMKAVQCVASAARGETVHPRSGDQAVATFALQRCTQCKRCTEECPFGTIDEDEKGTPEYNVLRCRRCGICFGACPERIISFPDYTVDAVASMIKAVEVPDEDEEKPRILALMCENDALPALEDAARKGLKWNPWIRIIPVRCLGSVNTVWVADSLSSGFDGVLLMGCRKGDDYQCHYVKGSELAAKRMENVQETLDRLALESDRIRIIEIARDEAERIPEIFAEFAEAIDEIGANPYKGF
jgi:quinone-modifying oxidoreductase subunit QmoB